MGDLPENEPVEAQAVPPRPGEAGWSASGWPNTARPREEQLGLETTDPSTEQPRWFSSDPGQVTSTMPGSSGVAQPEITSAEPDSGVGRDWGPNQTGPTFRQELPTPARVQPPPGPTFRQSGTEDLTTRFDAATTNPSARDSVLYGAPPAIPARPELPPAPPPPPPRPHPPLPNAESAPSGTSVRGKLASVAERFGDVAKVQPLDDSFSLRHLFGSTFERRSQDDVERELMVGTSSTTPSLGQIKARWPQPWLFARSLLATGLIFVLFFVGYSATENINLLPGLIIVGSFAMPTAVLIFFFEMNVARNVSIISVLRMVFLGGTASLLFSLLGFGLVDAPWLGATVAGVIEEPAKILAVVLVARQVRHRYILNGMLFGAAIGAGFAAFESAGFALVAALFALDTGDLIESILVRGVLSPFGHVVWTAITAGALWRVKGGDRLSFEDLKDPRFWRILVLTIALHAIWNSPIPSLLYLKYLLLGTVAWSVGFSLLQEGINQIRSEQMADLG